jgi:hypothetical protein
VSFQLDDASVSCLEISQNYAHPGQQPSVKVVFTNSRPHLVPQQGTCTAKAEGASASTSNLKGKHSARNRNRNRRQPVTRTAAAVDATSDVELSMLVPVVSKL